MKNTRVYLFAGLGCIAAVCLCALGVLLMPWWSAITTRATTSEEVASHPELQVQLVADLGEFHNSQVFFSPDGNHILKGQGSRYDQARNDFISSYQLYDKQGNRIADLGEAQRGYLTSEGIVLVTGASTPNEKSATLTASWKLSFWSFDGRLIKEEQGCCGTYPELIVDPTHSKFVTFRGYHPYSKGETEEYLWSSSGQQIAILSLPDGEGIEGVSFSSDGKLIAVAAKTTTGVLDESGNVLHMLSIPGHRHSHAEVYFSPDGKYLAVSDGERHTEVWTVDGQLITTLEVQTVAFSPDGQYLIGQTYINDHYDEILLFDIQNNFAPKSLIVYYEFYGVHFDPDGERFVTFGCIDARLRACLGSTATLWNKNGSLSTELKGLAEVTDAGFFSNSDSTISAGCDGIVNHSLIIPSLECLSYSLRLHDKDGNTTAILRDEIGYFWVSPDEEYFLTTSSQYSGNAKLWHLLR